jgi:hypothetical protein
MTHNVSSIQFLLLWKLIQKIRKETNIKKMFSWQLDIGPFVDGQWRIYFSLLVFQAEDVMLKLTRNLDNKTSIAACVAAIVITCMGEVMKRFKLCTVHNALFCFVLFCRTTPERGCRLHLEQERALS